MFDKFLIENIFLRTCGFWDIFRYFFVECSDIAGTFVCFNSSSWSEFCFWKQLITVFKTYSSRIIFESVVKQVQVLTYQKKWWEVEVVHVGSQRVPQVVIACY